MSKFVKKAKRPPALWMTINTPEFKAQRERIRPERSAAGGIKARSGSEEVRMAVYRPIAQMFKKLNPSCKVCAGPAEDVHHTKGREGLLLFDTRHWLAVCRDCHRHIHDNPALSKSYGILK